MNLVLDPVRVFLVAILVLWVGSVLRGRVGVLERLNVPVAVIGGIVASLGFAAFTLTSGREVAFDLSTRDVLLLTFFSTIGLDARLSRLRAGGRALLLLMGATLVFLILQNVVGVTVAALLGRHPGFGLIGGSVSFAGGHGTAITWGGIADASGFDGTTELGLAFATFGLIAGGLVGGPIASRLVRGLPDGAPKHHGGKASDADADEDAPRTYAVTSGGVIRTLFLLALCIAAGRELNLALSDMGTVVPGFLTSMAVGIVLTNLMAWRGLDLDEETLQLLQQVSLQLFLAMSLMSMQLTQLADSIGAIAVVLAAQVALVVVYSRFVVFRILGGDYDAAVASAGFAGLGLGATPVGVANMDAVTQRHGPSMKAMLIVPLIGAFFLDIANALVIQGALTLPPFELDAGR
ncbi:MAG: sodium/glutamate symporter [Planctomycetota bacterium]